MRLEGKKAEKFKQRYVANLATGLEQVKDGHKVEYLAALNEYLDEQKSTKTASDETPKDLIYQLINDPKIQESAKRIILEQKENAKNSLDSVLEKPGRMLQFSKLASKFSSISNQMKDDNLSNIDKNEFKNDLLSIRQEAIDNLIN